MTASKDIELLKTCKILLAIPIYSDPGTFIEMGIAHQMGIPVIVYCPDHPMDNLLADELPILVSSNLDEVIAEVFVQAEKLQIK